MNADNVNEGTPSREAMEARERVVLDLLLGRLHGAQAGRARWLCINAVRTLAAIRDALGCEPGGEVEAVQELRAELLRQVQEVARRDRSLCAAAERTGKGWAAWWALKAERDKVEDALLHADRRGFNYALWGGDAAEAAGVVMPAGLPLGGLTPRPGDTLAPADFGRGEAGVLRLAALLSEAPEGAVVRDKNDFHRRRDAGGAWRIDGDEFDGLTSQGVAEFAPPLTVVAWPEGGAS